MTGVVPIPEQIRVSQTQWWPVKIVPQAELPAGAHGALVSDAILISEDEPPIARHLVLLHEIIHLGFEALDGYPYVSPEWQNPPEGVVVGLAGYLFGVLSMNGLWNGVSPEAAEAWYTKQLAEEEALP